MIRYLTRPRPPPRRARVRMFGGGTILQTFTSASASPLAAVFEHVDIRRADDGYPYALLGCRCCGDPEPVRDTAEPLKVRAPHPPALARAVCVRAHTHACARAAVAPALPAPPQRGAVLRRTGTTVPTLGRLSRVFIYTRVR